MIPRIVLVLAGLAALALPLPAPDVIGGGLTLAGLVALAITVARPGSTAPAALIGVAALSWLSTPEDGARGLRLVGLALAIAFVHAFAALAAVVPARGHVPAKLLSRSAGWSVAATALGAGLMVAIGAAPVSIGRVWPTVAAVLVVAILAGIAAVAGRTVPIRDIRGSGE